MRKFALYAPLLSMVAAAFSPTAAPAQDAHLAVILPLSGAYARSGQLYLDGVKLAVEEINAGGGIKALNGKKLTIDVKDAGSSIETAVSAARQLLGSDTKITGGMGAWLSSFTMGVSEVAERRRVPWMTVSSSDAVSNRGLQYLYQIVAPSSEWAQSGLKYMQTLAEKKGCAIKTIAIVGDNTASPTAFFNAVRKDIAGQFGWKITVDATWTPPLADATAIAQRLKEAKPDLVLFGASNFADAVQVLGKGVEFKIKTNYIGNGSWLVMPEYVQSVGADNLEGIFDISGAHPLKGFDKIEDMFKKATKEPFLQQEGLAGYANVWIFKEAMELAKSDDPVAVNKAIKALDLTTGPAASALPSGRVKFNDMGRLVDATPVVAQWQKGLPVTVFPEARAAGTSNFACER